jgi:hypothetical protein
MFPEARCESASARTKIRPKVKTMNAYMTRAWGADKEKMAMPSFLAYASNAKRATKENAK